MFGFLRKSKRQAPPAGPIPPEWLAVLENNVLLYRRLPEVDRARLHDALRVFIAEKSWEGCNGLTVTDEMCVTVAAQACLLALGWGDYYFEGLHTVLLYPGSFLAPSRYDDPEDMQWRLGEAHHRGPVVLSWWHTRWDSRRLGQSNLVLHEFAHKLAELGDWDTGMPPTVNAAVRARWEEIVGTEYKRLVEAADYGRPTLLDQYGATSRAEFFAVATEMFFLQPTRFRRRHPELYQLLADVYRQDPSAWAPLGPAVTAHSQAADREYAEHALAECTAALRLRPDFTDAYRWRADHYVERGEYDKALADYTEVIHLTEGDERAAAFCDRGAAYREHGEHDKALADFDRALELLPHARDAYRLRGMTHADAGNLQRALADLTRAAKLDPDDDATYLERGRVYVEQGEYQIALRDLTKAIRLNPDDAETYRERAEVYAALGDGEKAAADRAKAEVLDNS